MSYLRTRLTEDAGILAPRPTKRRNVLKVKVHRHPMDQFFVVEVAGIRFLAHKFHARRPAVGVRILSPR